MCYTQVKVYGRCLAGTLHTGEDNRNSIPRGSIPGQVPYEHGEGDDGFRHSAFDADLAGVLDLDCTRAMASRVAVQDKSTKLDIAEQSHVPILMSLPLMRNARLQFNLHPDKAFLSSFNLGNFSCNLMWKVRFDKHKKSSFLTSQGTCLRKRR